MDDHGESGGPELAVAFFCTFYFLSEEGREFAGYGGDIDAGFFENAAIFEDRHFSAAARSAGIGSS